MRCAVRGSYGEDYTLDNEVILCDQGLALTVPVACTRVVPDPLASGTALE